MDRQVLSSREELKKMKEKIEEMEAKRECDSIEFTRTGNKHQFQFLQKIRRNLERMRKKMERGSEVTATTLVETIEEIDERCKHIKIADRSSWKTVDEYVQDPLASSASDERRIAQAEKRAKQKIEVEKEKKKISVFRKGNIRGGYRHGYRREEREFRDRSPARRDMRPERRGPGPNDICNSCGGRGHWSRECPKDPRGGPAGGRGGRK